MPQRSASQDAGRRGNRAGSANRKFPGQGSFEGVRSAVFVFSRHFKFPRA